MFRRLLVSVSVLALLAACAGSTPPGPTPGQSSTPASDTPGASAPAAAPARPAAPARDPKTARIKVFALSDFHGNLLPLEPKNHPKYYGGIANIAGMLEQKEKATPEDSLILDNGDMWTGPSVSTFLRGEPVIQAYNAMQVAAANIANHEFDFGQEILKARIGEAKFPFLGANIVKAGTQEQPSFVKPWHVVERDGVKVGIIGLSYVETPKTTLAKHVAGLEFKGYAETLKKVVPEVRAAGAEVIVVLWHDTVDTIGRTLEGLKELGIAAVVAGQNHRKGEMMVAGTPIVNPGPFGKSYVRFDIEVDRAKHEVTSVKHQIVDVEGEVGAPAVPPSPTLAAIAESAKQKAKSLSGEVLGRLAKPLPVGTFGETPLGNFVADAWLAAFPDVDVAICNHGALRQPLPSGQVTMGDVVSVLPFENNLYVVKLTGKQLKEQLAIDSPFVAGLTWKYKETPKGRVVVSAVDRVGAAIKDTKTYAVLINDFMYGGGDGFTFKDIDAAPEDTGRSIQEPVMRALQSAEASGNPLDPPATARAAKAK